MGRFGNPGFGVDPFGNGGFGNGQFGVAPGGHVSQYPPAQNTTYVKATSNFATNYLPEFATDPTKLLIGADLDNCWATASATNQRFHIDLGAAKLITRIYYENYHNSGAATDSGANTLIVQGSNNGAAFADLTYATDTNWTAIVASGNFAQHVGTNTPDPQFISLTNTVAYRYYALKFADTWGGAYMGVRRIELQT